MATITGNWTYRSGAVTADPGAGNYRTDGNTPSQAALSGTDAEGNPRDLTAVSAGDTLWTRSLIDDQNYQEWDITAVTDNGTWLLLSVTVAGTGSSWSPPGSGTLRQLELETASTGSPPTSNITQVMPSAGWYVRWSVMARGMVEMVIAWAVLEDGTVVPLVVNPDDHKVWNAYELDPGLSLLNPSRNSRGSLGDPDGLQP
jgi:hypothetical protein